MPDRPPPHPGWASVGERTTLCSCGWPLPQNIQVLGLPAATFPTADFNIECPVCGRVWGGTGHVVPANDAKH